MMSEHDGSEHDGAAPTRRGVLAGAAGLAMVPAASAGAAAAEAARVRLSTTLGFRPQNGHYTSAGGTGQTFGNAYEIESPATRVRLFWFNDLPAPWTVDAAAVAISSRADAAMEPVDAEGRADPRLWRRVGGLTLPGDDGSPAEPVLRVSEWVEVEPVPRRDGGRGAWLLVRCFSQGAIRYCVGGPPDPAMGRTWRGAWTGGDAASPPFAADRWHDLNFLHACYGLQYESTVPGATVLGIGDSIMQSARTTHGVSGFGARACALISTPRLPVSYFNEGYSGRKSANYAADGLHDIELLRPQVTLIQAWSENDPPRPDVAEAAFDRATRLIEATRRAGGAPVLVTAAPVFVHHPAGEGVRRDSNERVRALAGSGVPVLDLDRVWGDGGAVNGYRPDYDSGDATHPNDAAAAAAAQALVPILRAILG